MCGISGLFSLKNGHLHVDMIRQMTDLIRHRGPDDEGFLVVSKKQGFPFGGKDTPAAVHAYPYSSPLLSEHESQEFPSAEISLLLGHRRLSILDLSPTGHQPMQQEHQGLWITYNGEVFNYLEIRQELEQKGFHFHTHSDTEVILNAYSCWGIDCLHHFNGMFAFILIDLKRNKLFAARDRFGVKPLYLWHSEGFLALASEIKQFTCLPGWSAKAHLPSAIHYLLHGMTNHSEKTMFEGVTEIRGGQYIECDLPLAEIPAIKTWYKLKKNPLSMPFHQAKEHFYDLFEDAVRLRLRADVDIGSCLSGGLDSSAIVCMMHRLLGSNNQQQKTFSACSHVPRFDEKHYMDEVISQTRSEAHFVTPSLDSLFPTLKKIVWHQDEPFGSTSIYAQHLVFEMAHKANVKVMLDGQGSDEVLAGYHPFWYAHFSHFAKKLRWMKLIQEYRTATKINPSLELLGLLKQMLPKKLKNTLKSFIDSNQPWINFDDFERCDFAFDHLHQDLEHPVDRLSHEQLTITSLPALLRYEDRNSMAHSIEARTPFLDYRLVEFIFNLSAEHKISEGHTKKILREGLKGLLPERIRTRTDKLGFATAEESWMCDEQPELFRQALKDAVDKSQGLLNHHALKMGEDILQRRRPFNWVLWRIINFGYWLDTFNVKLR